MAHAPRVAGQIHPLGEVVGAPDAGGEGDVLVLGKLGGLVQKDHVVLLPLVLVHIPLPVAVAEFNPAAPRKEEGLFTGPVLGKPPQVGEQGQDMVFLQFRKRPAQDEDADARPPQGQQPGLLPDGPALAAAPGAAVGHKPLPGPEELQLLGVGVDGDGHCASSSSSGERTMRTVASVSRRSTKAPRCLPSSSRARSWLETFSSLSGASEASRSAMALSLPST